MKKLRLLSSVSVLVLGCSHDGDPSQETIQSGALALTVDVTGKSDIGRVRYEVTPVDCESGAPSGPSEVTVRELEPTTIPGGIENLEDAPLDKESEHIFADAFLTMPPGCYDVSAIPLKEDGTPSAVCASARKRGVRVVERSTTEIFLMSQCEGRDPGSLDLIVTLNHEPELLDLRFEDSKFSSCDEAQVMCATVKDVDFDPIEFAWTLKPGSPPADGPRIVSRDLDVSTGTVTECVEFVPRAEGRYEMELRVYDLVYRDGELTRIETWLAEEGYPSESHASQDFFFYASDCDPSGSGGSSSGGSTGSGGDPGSGGDSASGGADAVGGSGSGGEVSTGGSESGGSTSTGGAGTGGTGGGDTSGGSEFDIDLRPVDPLTPVVEAAFHSAVSRLEAIVVDDLVDVVGLSGPAGACGTSHPALIGETIDDLAIFVHFGSIDGAGGILAQAGPCVVRTGSSLPALGTMTFDADDVDWAVSQGLLEGIVLHEMAHVLGFGTLWTDMGLLAGGATLDPYFPGASAISRFNTAGGASYPGLKVPVENTGGPGTALGHFRESILGAELMTGYVNPGVPNPVSAISIAALEDMGYGVDYSTSESFTIPSGAFLKVASKGVHLEDDVHDGPRYEVDETGVLQALDHH